MTIVPLVFALIVTGIAAAARSAEAGGLAARALATFAALLAGAALISILLVPPLLGLWTLRPEEVAGLAEAFRSPEPPPQIPPIADAVRSLVPTNVVASAAEGAIVPLVVFGLVFGIAAARLPDGRGAPLLAFFEALKQAMLTIVHWVLWLAPVGVFALALVVGSRLGLGAGAALLHYIGVQIALALILILLLYPVAAVGGRVPIGRFARAIAPAQAVAASTQSSLASLPPMIESAERLRLREEARSVVLPLAVAVFRITSTTSIVITVLAMARMSGIEVGPAQLLLVGLLSILGSLLIIGLPGQVSFFAAQAPAALAIGVPIEFLPILLAVDTIPDIFRTVANVTADMTAATLVGRPGETAAGG
jgi:Na+/H+-dicarboxylate symporter